VIITDFKQKKKQIEENDFELSKLEKSVDIALDFSLKLQYM